MERLFEAPRSNPEKHLDTLSQEAILLEDALGAVDDEEYELTIRDRVENALNTLKATAKGAGLGLLLLAAVGSANQARTRYSVEETVGPQGTTYQHQDPETTQILEEVTGVRPLSPEHRLEMQLRIVLRDYELRGQPVPEYDGTPTYERLLEDLTALNLEHGNSVSEVGARRTAEKALTLRQPQENRELLEKLWQIQKETGAPRIRWLPSGSNDRAHYNALTNTMYIAPDEPVYTIVGESAHAKQYNEQPIRTWIISVRDQARTWIKSYADGTGYDEAQTYMYETPGSEEHETHTKIAPELHKRFGVSDKRTDRRFL